MGGAVTFLPSRHQPDTKLAALAKLKENARFASQTAQRKATETIRLVRLHRNVARITFAGIEKSEFNSVSSSALEKLRTSRRN